MAERDVSTTHLAPVSPALDGDVRLPADAWMPSVGTVIAGKYRIDGLLGRGGMGVVVLGRQLELDRPVAIKFLRAPLALDARPLQRFAREARIIARMRSEHVVRVFDVGREIQVPFIVMERLAGHDLSKEIEGGPLGVERAVEFVLHACEALGEAHSLGIVHRDVKPSNLFVAEGFGGKELLKVLDFGVSKWLAPSRDSGTASLSTGDGAVGTPAFASPEQLTHPEDIDGRTDVWALGVVLYQALSGALPFQAETIPALYSRIIGGAPEPFPSDRDVPAELVAVIERCLCRSPSERYASMLELARALAPFAPARALGIVDSLATLATPEHAARLSEPFEPLDSALSTTLEFSQSAPRAVEPLAVARARRPKGVFAGLSVLAALSLGAAAAWWPRSVARTTAPTRTTDAAGTFATTNDAAGTLATTNDAKRVPATTTDAAGASAPAEPSAHFTPRLATSSSVVAAAEPQGPTAVASAPPSVGVAKSKASLHASEHATNASSASKPKPVIAVGQPDAANERAGAIPAVPQPSAAPARSAAPVPSASAARGDGIPLYRR